MSTAIAITCIIIQTVIITGAFCYWLHLRSVRRLTSNFKINLEQMIGIITDDPRYTVNVRTIDPSKLSSNQHPYDWKTHEEFDKIIDKNFPHSK
jgi:hypothetical protein